MANKNLYLIYKGVDDIIGSGGSEEDVDSWVTSKGVNPDDVAPFYTNWVEQERPNYTPAIVEAEFRVPYKEVAPREVLQNLFTRIDTLSAQPNVDEQVIDNVVKDAGLAPDDTADLYRKYKETGFISTVAPRTVTERLAVGSLSNRQPREGGAVREVADLVSYATPFTSAIGIAASTLLEGTPAGLTIDRTSIHNDLLRRKIGEIGLRSLPGAVPAIKAAFRKVFNPSALLKAELIEEYGRFQTSTQAAKLLPDNVATRAINKEGYKRISGMARTVAKKAAKGENVEKLLNDNFDELLGFAQGTFADPKAAAKSASMYINTAKEMGLLTKSGTKDILTDTLLDQYGGAMGNKPALMSAWDTLKSLGFRRSNQVINDFGEAGKGLVSGLHKADTMARFRTGQWSEAILTPMSKLNKAELGSLVDVIEGRVKATPAQKEVVKVWQAATKLIATRSKAQGIKMILPGGKRVNFETKANFFPHEVDAETLVDGKTRAKFVTAVMKEFKLTRAQALTYVKDLADGKLFGRAGSLEFPRLTNLPYAKDPAAMIRYLDKSFVRLEQARVFGADMKGLDNALSRIALEAGDEAAIFAKTSVQAEIAGGATAVHKKMAELGVAARSFQVVKMSLSPIANMFQKVNAFMATDLDTTARAFLQYRTKGAKKFAVESGALLDRILSESMKGKLGADPKKLSGKFLKAIGFVNTESGNRQFSSTAGKLWGWKNVNKLWANPTNNKAKAALLELGLKPNMINRIIKTRKVPDLALKQMGQVMSDRTQFRANPMNMPQWWSSPMGKLVTQFKNFSYNQGIFLYDEIIQKGVKKGNLIPLTKFMTAYGLTGEIVADIRAAISGRWDKRQEQSFWMRLFENYSYAGGIGLLSDTIQAGLWGVDSVLSTMVGPTFSDVGNVVYGGIQAGLNQNFNPLIQQSLGYVPILGARLKRLQREGL